MTELGPGDGGAAFLPALDPQLATLMLACVSDAILLIDESDILRYWGPGAERLFNVSAKEALGQNLSSFYRIEWDQAEEHQSAARALSQQQLWRGENTIVLRDGQKRRVESTVRVMRDPSTGRLGYLAVIRDVTERFQKTEALRTSEERARLADLRKSEFLAMLSHELRNPLASIRNSLQIVAHPPPKGPAGQQALRIMERQVSHLCRLVDDLLDLTRISSGKLQLVRDRIDVAELIRCAATDHRSLFEQRGIRLSLTLAPQPLFTDGDRTRLSQVIGNLLHNAAKFTDAGGLTEVKLEAESDSGMLRLSVRDTGIGIPEELLPSLLQPFVQADTTLSREQGGLGLGLSLAKSIVELHGGTISVSSKGLGQGALFVIRLRAETAANAAPAPPAASPNPPGRRVLIIDDNLDAAESLRLLLEFSGHSVSVAGDGPSGLALARSAPLDIVLCDIGLPLMNGYEVASAFRADRKLCGIRLVAISGYARAEDLARSKAAGFDAHLAKPPALEAIERELARGSRQ